MSTNPDELLEELSAAINYAYNETGHKEEILHVQINPDDGMVELVGEKTSVTVTPIGGEYIINYPGREELLADKMKAAEQAVAIFVEEEL